jgi:hypothetical protein
MSRNRKDLLFTLIILFGLSNYYTEGIHILILYLINVIFLGQNLTNTNNTLPTIECK